MTPDETGEPLASAWVRAVPFLWYTVCARTYPHDTFASPRDRDVTFTPAPIAPAKPLSLANVVASLGGIADNNADRYLADTTCRPSTSWGRSIDSRYEPEFTPNCAALSVCTPFVQFWRLPKKNVGTLVQGNLHYIHRDAQRRIQAPCTHSTAIIAVSRVKPPINQCNTNMMYRAPRSVPDITKIQVNEDRLPFHI